MKNIAFLSVGDSSLAYYTEKAELIRKKTGADRLINIMEGEYNNLAAPIREDPYRRAHRMYQAGADLVVREACFLPTLPRRYMALAVAYLIEEIGCLDGLALFYQDTDPDTLRKIADILYRGPETDSFRTTMEAAEARGIDPEIFVKDAVEGIFPGARRVMDNEDNMFTINMLRALKLAKSDVQAILIDQSCVKSNRYSFSTDMLNAWDEGDREIIKNRKKQISESMGFSEECRAAAESFRNVPYLYLMTGEKADRELVGEVKNAVKIPILSDSFGDLSFTGNHSDDPDRRKLEACEPRAHLAWLRETDLK